MYNFVSWIYKLCKDSLTCENVMVPICTVAGHASFWSFCCKVNHDTMVWCWMSRRLYNPRYVAVLPTPQTILTFGLDQKLGHSVSNCKSERFTFQILESELTCKYYRISKWSHNHFQLCYPPDIELNNDAMFWHTSLISLEHKIILVFILTDKLCHIP